MAQDENLANGVSLLRLTILEQYKMAEAECR